MIKGIINGLKGVTLAGQHRTRGVERRRVEAGSVKGVFAAQALVQQAETDKEDEEEEEGEEPNEPD
jgi:hypothetical protein